MQQVHCSSGSAQGQALEIPQGHAHYPSFRQPAPHHSPYQSGFIWLQELKLTRNLIKANTGYLPKSKCRKDTGHKEKFNPKTVLHQESKTSALKFLGTPQSHWSLEMFHFCSAPLCCWNLSFSAHWPATSNSSAPALILIFSLPSLSAP